MARPNRVLLPVVGMFVLVACSPAQAWYKQAAGPSYYSVGRASGLLSGLRRSPYVRRAELRASERGEPASIGVFSGPQHPLLQTTPVCISHVTPKLQSCQLLRETKGSFLCKADVFVSLGSSACERSSAVKLVLDDEA